MEKVRAERDLFWIEHFGEDRGERFASEGESRCHRSDMLRSVLVHARMGCCEVDGEMGRVVWSAVGVPVIACFVLHQPPRHGIDWRQWSLIDDLFELGGLAGMDESFVGGVLELGNESPDAVGTEVIAASV